MVLIRLHTTHAEEFTTVDLLLTYKIYQVLLSYLSPDELGAFFGSILMHNFGFADLPKTSLMAYAAV